MRLATLYNGRPDGSLIVVSDDNLRFLSAAAIAPTLQSALDDWAGIAPRLENLSRTLASEPGESVPTDKLLAPLPRAWQWLDASAFASHGALMARVFGIQPVESSLPLMYQGLSNQFLSPGQNARFPEESLGIDFEGEFAVEVDAVPMGTSCAAAMAHIKLIMQVNDWSLRTLAGPEMKTGFGWIQAKPACSAAPIALTPDELGESWRDGRVHLHLTVDWNGKRFGNAHGGAMGFGFHELVAHAARTRDLCAGTIIGSGTVSNDNFREIGSSCIAERRGIEVVDEGAARTAFMSFGDRVRMEAKSPNGNPLFGTIDQRVVKA